MQHHDTQIYNILLSGKLSNTNYCHDILLIE
jgi:hypothetical protein